MTKKIKLMAEYNYSPLWDIEEGDNIELDELPITLVKNSINYFIPPIPHSQGGS